MARPKKTGQKKGNIPLSATPDQKGYIKDRAKRLGFGPAARYLMALVEAERRIGLVVMAAPDTGEPRFVLPDSKRAPTGSTDGAIEAYVCEEAERLRHVMAEDREHAERSARAAAKKQGEKFGGESQ